MALKKALKESPASIRATARAAGVSHALLILARDGKTPLTPKVSRKLVRAFRKWSKLYAELADRLEETEADK